MNLNKLRDEAYSIAKTNGWHNEEHSDNHWLMLVITEIAEAVQADCNNLHADIPKFKEWQGNSLPLSEETRIRRFKEDFEAYIKNSVEDELSDVVIRCLDLCGLRKLNAYALYDVVFPTEVNTFTERMFFICRLLTDRMLANDNAALEFALSRTMSYIVGHCYRKGIDLEFFTETKMKYNRLRGYRHGGKRY